MASPLHRCRCSKCSKTQLPRPLLASFPSITSLTPHKPNVLPHLHYTPLLSPMSPPPPMDSKPNSSSSPAAAAAAKKPASAPAAAPPSPPCGACKFLRRKCVAGCVFAPHFGSDQGSARFAAVHKVFGASNVSKLLQHVAPGRRHDAVVTICYEAQARLSDPVYGCVSTILALQQQVASLQAELSIVQSQLINSKLAAAAGALQSSQQITSVLQPAYSNNSAASTNMPDTSSFPAAASLDLSDAAALPPSRGLEPLQLSRALYDEEEENQDPAVFANGVYHPK